MFRTPHIAQFIFRRLLELFDPHSVEVSEHLKHSNMETFETRN